MITQAACLVTNDHGVPNPTDYFVNMVPQD